MVVKSISVFVLDFLSLHLLLIYKFLTSLWQFLSVCLHVLDFWWNVYIALTATQDLLPIIPRNIECLSAIFKWTFENTAQKYLWCLFSPSLLDTCLLTLRPWFSILHRKTVRSQALFKAQEKFLSEEKWEPDTLNSNLASVTAILDTFFTLWHLMVKHHVTSQLGSWLFAHHDFCTSLQSWRCTHLIHLRSSDLEDTTTSATRFSSSWLSDLPNEKRTNCHSHRPMIYTAT